MAAPKYNVPAYLEARARGERRPAPAFAFTLPALKALPVDPAGEYTVADTKLVGLRCRVRPSGGKTLFLEACPAGSKRTKKVKVCAVGEMALDGQHGARTLAGELLAELRRGDDPNARRKAQRAEAVVEGVTLREAWQQYEKHNTLRPATAAAYKLTVDRELADWADRPLAEISGKDAFARFAELRQESQHRAARAMKCLRAIHHWANGYWGDEDEDPLPFGACPVNKVNRLAKKWADPGARERKLAANDVARWLAAVRTLDATQERGDGQRNAEYLEVLLLTALRRRELSDLPWSDVDLEKGTLTITADRTKNKREHVLPLTKRVHEILKARHNSKGDAELAFGINEIKRAVAVIEQQTGLHISPHDLRRSWASFAERGGIGQYTIKRAMNHLSGGDVTGQHYAKVDLDDLRAAMQRVEDHILALAADEGAKVVQLRG